MDITQVFKVEYDAAGKPAAVAVAVRSRGKGRLYISDKRVNGCKDNDYVLVVAKFGGGPGLSSYTFSLSGEEAMATWLERARRDVAGAHATLKQLTTAFVALGLDARGEPIPPGPGVAIPTKKAKSPALPAKKVKVKAAAPPQVKTRKA